MKGGTIFLVEIEEECQVKKEKKNKPKRDSMQNWKGERLFSEE